MAVIDPVELHLEDVEEEALDIPLFPKNEEKGKRTIRLTKLIYVDREDIQLEDEKGYYGIAPNKVVGLKYFSSVYIREVREEGGVIVSVRGEIDKQVSML